MKTVMRAEDGITEYWLETDDLEQLYKAMRFKAENIKAKAEPELFHAVADALYEFVNLRDVIKREEMPDVIKMHKWLHDAQGQLFCSNCRLGAPIFPSRYCPNCGGLMERGSIRRGEEEIKRHNSDD